MWHVPWICLLYHTWWSIRALIPLPLACVQEVTGSMPVFTTKGGFRSGLTHSVNWGQDQDHGVLYTSIWRCSSAGWHRDAIPHEADSDASSLDKPAAVVSATALHCIAIAASWPAAAVSRSVYPSGTFEFAVRRICFVFVLVYCLVYSCIVYSCVDLL